jgi:ribosome-binding protein aMBF1 (putative translation factor)
MIHRRAGMAGIAVAAPGFLRARRTPPYRPGPASRQVDAAVGRRLREARSAGGISLEQLGEAIGVSADTVRRYETGARRIPPARLAAAVRFLGVSLAWFFSNGEPSTRPRR